MTALLLWLLAGVLPGAAAWLRALFRNPARLTFLDRPLPRMLRARVATPARPDTGPVGAGPEHPALAEAGLPPRAHGGAGEPRTPRVRGHETGARRPRRRERGQHRAGPLRIDLATTDTIPRLPTPDRPPWHTQPFPEVTP